MVQEKKKRILEASIELFAKQGYHATSVQEIVNEADMAKGSFYNYFDSKDELITTLYHYYFGQIQHQMDEAKQDAVNPRDSLERQLEIFFNFLLSNKSLIIMLLQDQVPIHEDFEEFVRKSRQQNFNWVSSNILEIYGEEIEPYLIDATILFMGILQSYSSWLVIDQDSMQPNRLPKFLINRLDDLCTQLMARKEEPLVNRLPDYLMETELIIQEIDQKLMIVQLDEAAQQRANEAMAVLKKQIRKDNKEAIVIESMLQILVQIDEIKDEVEKLQSLIK